ncbi:unnamed protein product [Rhodiola kirilowii]
MKRLGDDLYVRSQFKRPFLSSRTESYVESQTGGGEGTSQRRTTNDALTYLKEVKDIFEDQRETYDQFLEVMKNFKAQRTNTAGVIQRVKELFKGHNNLILGFNTFLPKGYEITLEEKKTVEFEEAIDFVTKIKKRFQYDEHVYKSFLDILNMYRKEHKGITEVYQEVAVLFDDHPDLLDEFTRFLPDNSAAPSMNQEPYSHFSLQRYDERSSAMPTLTNLHSDKQHRRPRILASHTNRDLSVDSPALESDKAITKMHKEQRKRAEKEARERRHRDHEYRELEHERKPSKKVEGFGNAKEDDKNAIKSLYNREFSFCEKVKERVTDPDEYQTFLKCLNIYSTEIVSRTDLQSLMTDVLGKYPDLVEGFNDFLEHCENIDGFLASVMNKNSKVEERVKTHKQDIDTTKETDRSKEKYLAKSIQELDLSNCQRCTPSYRLLPEDYPIQRASQRSDLGAQVLNDHWVSVTSGSEDYSFKHMRRNQYEESLFRCEDDRFELDMLLESVSSASRRVEELLNKLNDDTLDIETPLHVEEHFSALNVRCIERLYGDHGLDVVDILRKNPYMALPVILTRLKQKQEEWARCRSDFNMVWADIYSKNHYKSLDHRSFYFKQQDSKNLSTKSLVAEIKEIKETKQEHDALLTMATGNNWPIIPNLEFEYPDPDIHGNLYELVHYSCKEICSTKEQLNKVMRLWATFLEPMLGIPARIGEGECIEAIAADGHQDVDVKASLGSTKKPNGTLTYDAAIKNTWIQKPSSIGNEVTLPERHVAHEETFAKDDAKFGIDSSNKNGTYSITVQSETELKNSVTKISSCGVKVASDQQYTTFAVPLSIATETSPRKICIDLPSPAPSRHIIGGSENGASLKPNSSDNLLEDGSSKKSDKLENGVTTDGTKSNGYNGLSGGLSKVEKEEGELSPIGKSEDDVPRSPVEDQDVRSAQYVVGEAISSQDAVEDNDADVDDVDSENPSMAVEVSGSESGEEEGSHEVHDEEDEAEHDDIDGKVESEGEAEGLVDANCGDGAVPSTSECFWLNAKPLAKYVPLEWRDNAKKDTRVFYGNDNYYVLLRLHQMLYERILFAKTNTVAAEVKQGSLNDDGNLEPFTRFVKALNSLLDGSADNAKFEDDCRSLIGNHSYVLFTLDKLVYKLVKQLQSVASDETDIKLFELYDYEKSRECENRVDSDYHENARILLQEDNIYRFEFASSLPRLSIQLMHSESEKQEFPAAYIDSNFAGYLNDDFLATIPSKQEPSGVLLQRNKLLLLGSLDESSDMLESMDGVKTMNRLDCKIVCDSSKTSYVLNTEDYLFRPKRKRKNVAAERATRINQTRVERLHRLLHVFNDN